MTPEELLRAIFGSDSNYRIDKPTPAAHSDETGLREDELVCPVTYLTYLKGTCNPHIDDEGKAL